MEQGNVTLSTEYPQAVRSIYAAKNILWVFVGICIILQLAVFVMVGIVGTTDALHCSKDATTQVAGTEDTTLAVSRARFWEDSVFRVVLASTRFMVMVLTGLLALTLLLGVLVSLVGRLGGVGALLSAFFWSLWLLALLTPWQQTLHSIFLPGATFGLEELVTFTKEVRSAWGATDVSLFTHIWYYARFAAYPLLTLAVWGVVQLKCSRGFGRMALQSVSAGS